MSRGYGTTFGVGATDSVTSSYGTAVASVLSLSAWVYVNSTASVGRVMHQGPGAGSTRLILGYGSGSSFLFIYGFSTTAANFALPLPSVGFWTHIVVVYDATSTANVPTVYYNGIKQTVTTTVAPVGTAGIGTSNIFIGNNAASGSQNWDGMLGYATYWNGVLLTAPEALALACGVHPMTVRPEAIAMCMPLDGVNKPEFDYCNAPSKTITGTKLGTSEPPVMPFGNLNMAFKPLSNSPAIISAYSDPLWFGMTA